MRALDAFGLIRLKSHENFTHAGLRLLVLLHLETCIRPAMGIPFRSGIQMGGVSRGSNAPHEPHTNRDPGCRSIKPSPWFATAASRACWRWSADSHLRCGTALTWHFACFAHCVTAAMRVSNGASRVWQPTRCVVGAWALTKHTRTRTYTHTGQSNT